MKHLVSLLFVIWPLSAQVERDAGQWKTWIIPSGSAMRLGAPPAGDIHEYGTSVGEDCMGRRDQPTLDHPLLGRRRAGVPLDASRNATIANSSLAGPQQTRALALVATAISEPTVASWDSKYAYGHRYPSTVDPTITTVVAVPQSPAYPSEHALTAGAAAAVLSYLFPDEAAKFSDMAYQAAIPG